MRFPQRFFRSGIMIMMLLFIGISGIIIVTLSQAATITVTNGNDNGDGSLRQAIANAASGDIIVFQTGISTVTLTTDQLVIDKNLTIDGGTGVTVQRAAETSKFRIFYMGSSVNVTIKNATLNNGQAPDGINSTNNSTDGTDGDNGGGLCADGCMLTLENCTISGNSAGRGGMGVEYSNGGNGGNGGGVYVNGGSLILTDSIVKENKAGEGGESGNGGDGGFGGGIYVINATLTLEYSDVIGNASGNGGEGGFYDGFCSGEGIQGRGGDGGGIYFSGERLTLKNGSVTDNSAGSSGGCGLFDIGGDGGGIYANGTVLLENSMLSNNMAGSSMFLGYGGSGGGIYGSDSGNITLTGCTVRRNIAGNGGLCFAHYCDTDFFTSNDGGSGGGIYNAGGTVIVENSIIIENATGDGGTSSSEDGYAYTGGKGGDGGGIWARSITLENSILHNNTTGNGGKGKLRIVGFYADGGKGGDGGGIWASTLLLENSTVSNNISGKGGAGCESDGNGTDGYYGNGGEGGSGGGIYAGSMTLKNTTVSGNIAGDGGNGSDGKGGNGGSGGGIYVSSATLGLENSTVYDNKSGSYGYGWSGQNGNAGNGGGLFLPTGSTLEIRNTILSGNNVASGGDGSDFHRSAEVIFYDRSYNIIGTYPRLGPLADNGGPTPTHALMSDSPAIDAGSCTGIDGNPIIGDQRGSNRPEPAGGSCDIGAYELDQTSPDAPAQLDLSSEDDTGKSNDDNLTNATSWLTITGSGENNAQLQLYSDGIPVGETVTVSDGIFSVDISLTEGIHSIRAGQTDVAGNSSDLSLPLLITVDTTAPFGSVTVKDNNGYTDDSTPELTLSADGAVFMRIGLTESTLSSAKWLPYAYSYDSFDISQGGDGEKRILAQFQDAAGNILVSPASDSTVYDTTSPGRPKVTGTTPTNDTTPEWNWTSGGDGNGTYRYKMDNSDLAAGATETASSKYAPDTPLSEGTHTLYVQERDIVGNWSDSGSFTIEIDISASPPPLFLDTTTFSPTNNKRPTWK
ncbi:Ig-like domain-containing protein [Desulfococcaceae bacterium HSG8]|nr:Ig-like domain-containing protein [Desulfococcaceae bacterium HSG8]